VTVVTWPIGPSANAYCLRFISIFSFFYLERNSPWLPSPWMPILVCPKSLFSMVFFFKLCHLWFSASCQTPNLDLISGYGPFREFRKPPRTPTNPVVVGHALSGSPAETCRVSVTPYDTVGISFMPASRNFLSLSCGIKILYVFFVSTFFSMSDHHKFQMD